MAALGWLLNLGFAATATEAAVNITVNRIHLVEPRPNVQVIRRHQKG